MARTETEAIGGIGVGAESAATAGAALGLFALLFILTDVYMDRATS